MSYIEKPIGILDRKDQVLRNRTISLVKILWQHHTSDEATWEEEDEVRNNYPELFD
ncbi:hypothetical protein AXF42_Ash021737 [Apostasia shenzhenica]|uniref:Chromo domain-containing protein n=1 Tax=Apostasia shenzhenica TaxID=1088818 RepID=A0A2H9ZY11_9ASPA|nr:hypothetical protein AXF42_Ash021737 [Apostasia shenzhenica]